MTAAFLCGRANIETITLDNSAAYIAWWIWKLGKDKRLVVTAAAQAQKAADYILGKHPTAGGTLPPASSEPLLPRQSGGGELSAVQEQTVRLYRRHL